MEGEEKWNIIFLFYPQGKPLTFWMGKAQGLDNRALF